ncbi:MAG: hypothetical protein ACRBCJ_02715 [Hyphomicrobiaceae bacterium]
MKSLIVAVCAAGVIAVWSEKLPAAELSGANLNPISLITPSN